MRNRNSLQIARMIGNLAFMKKKQDAYVWAKQQMVSGLKPIICKTHDPYKDFRRDPTGYYVLIRPNFETRTIELAICNKAHVIEAVFIGHSCQDVYEGVFQYEKKQAKHWFKDKGHCAYIGKELKKAELALVLGQNNYFQE